MFLLRLAANFLLDFASGPPGKNSIHCMHIRVVMFNKTNISSTWNHHACMTTTEPTIYSVKIGLSGGIRGYQSITGKHRIISTSQPVQKLSCCVSGLSGWGIASVAENCNSELQEYLDTLNMRCQGDSNDAAILT